MSGWMGATRTENSGGSPNTITVQISGEKLDKKDTFGKGGMIILLSFLPLPALHTHHIPPNFSTKKMRGKIKRRKIPFFFDSKFAPILYRNIFLNKRAIAGKHETQS